MGKTYTACRLDEEFMFVTGKCEGNRPLGDLAKRHDNIKMDLTKMGWNDFGNFVRPMSGSSGGFL